MSESIERFSERQQIFYNRGGSWFTANAEITTILMQSVGDREFAPSGPLLFDGRILFDLIENDPRLPRFVKSKEIPNLLLNSIVNNSNIKLGGTTGS